MDLQDPVCFELLVTYLYLMVNVPLDRDHIERYRIVLNRLFSSIRLANPNATIIQYEAEPKRSNNKNSCSQNLYIDQIGKILRSITQLQKYFPRGKPKRGSGTVFTNLLLLHNEKIEDMVIDIKDNMQTFNPKIGK